MPAFQHIPLSIIEPITPQKLAQGGAAVDAVPQFNGTEYVPRLPVSALNAGSLLGRVSEINITGAGGFASIVGNRLNLSINGGVNARSTFPSIGAYQSVNNIDLGAGINTTISAGTLTISTSAATPQVGLYNVGPGAGIVQSPGASSSHNLKTLVGLGGITIQDFGSYLGIQSATGGSTFSQFRVQTADTFGNVTGNEFITDNGIVRFTAGAGIGISQTSLGIGSTLLTISATGGTGGGLTGNNGNGLTVTPTTVSLALASTSSAGALPALSGNGGHFLRGDGFWGILGASAVTSFNGSTGAINLQNGTNTTVTNLGGGNFRIDATGGTGTSGHTLGNGAMGVGIVSVPGFATSHTLKGLIGTGGTTVTDMGSHIQISSTATGGGSIEVRYNNSVISPNTSIVNFSGAGVNVSNLGYVEVNIPGGGGTSGVAVNGVGNYNNLIFTGAGVSTSGNVITIPGGSGGSLTGFSGNGLTVTSNSVSLAMASGANAGAMPILPMNSALYLNGIGQWTAPSVGAGGAVNQVTSGNSSILQVSPTTGNVVITPIGHSQVFMPSFNSSTFTLTVPATSHQSGILTNQTSEFLDLSILRGITFHVNTSFVGNLKTLHLREGTGITLTHSFPNSSTADITINATGGLPPGTINQTLRHDGSAWVATSRLRVDEASNLITAQNSTINVINPGGFWMGVGSSNHGQTGLNANAQLGIDATELQLRSNRLFLGRRFGSSLHPTLLTEPVVLCLGDLNSKLSFFGGQAQFRQNLPPQATDPASTQALANAIRTGLINLNLFQ